MEFVKYQGIGNDYLVYDVIKNKEVLTREQIKKICETCPFWKICRGGCKRQNRTYLTEEWCGHREFLMEAYPTLFRIAQTL